MISLSLRHNLLLGVDIHDVFVPDETERQAIPMLFSNPRPITVSFHLHQRERAIPLRVSI